MFGLGVFWLCLHGYSYHAIFDDNQIDRFTIHQSKRLIEFDVVEISQQKASQLKITANIVKLDGRPLVKPFTARLNYRITSENNTVQPTFFQGQRWQACVKLKPAYGFANPVGFAYQRWLREKNIHLTGYIYNKTPNTLKAISTGQTVRQKLFTDVASSMAGSAYQSIVMALSFGERYQISQAQWQVFQLTNTSHLIAISGLHIGLVFWLLVWLLSNSFRIVNHIVSCCFAKSYLTINTRWTVYPVVLLLSLLGAVFYAYLANFSMPTIRALIMLAIYVLALVMAIHLSKTRLILLTVAVILLIEPMALISPSFWLSFCAVSCIFFVLWRTQAWRNRTSKSLLLKFNQFVGWRLTDKQQAYWQVKLHSVVTLVVIQCALSTLLVPITALLSQQVSLSSVAANLVAVPWMSFVVIPLILFNVVLVMLNSQWLNKWVSQWISDTLDLLWHYLSWLAQQTSLVWSISNLQWLLILSALLILLAISVFSYKRWLLVSLVVVASLPLLLTELTPWHKGDWQVRVFDVGHGLSVLVEQQYGQERRAVLYDTGAGKPNGFSFAQSFILPYLKSRGIKQLDYLVLSHNDNDHNGGFAALISGISVQQVIASYPEKLSFAVLDQTKLITCDKNKQFAWHALNIEMISLAPKPTTNPTLTSKNKKRSDNDKSCVIKIGDGEKSILLPGDISKTVELALVEQYHNQGLLTANVLIAPHHGSKTSSTTAFIEAVTPNIVIFSTGYLNRWNMPNKEVISRYQMFDVATYNTAELGSILLEFDTQAYATKVKVSTMKQNLRPYWLFN
ncbi:DNA internalization-related competence protein ComEC/Rec2 [Thalassotalea sp. LPB0316]|nr:DNA internalization-related competence protein ComEC/Rec2 [Thalassotalea sp. LPB0316]